MPEGSIVEEEFLAIIEARKNIMKNFEGYLDSNVENVRAGYWLYTTKWTKKVLWEEYMWSKEATVSQMPVGMWQFPQDPKKGIGEPYVPILRLEEF